MASGIRLGLSVAGPIGVIVGEFLTQFVPKQRVDRLQDFVELLAERMTGFEERFYERLSSSAGYAALAEQASLSAVGISSKEHRRDLAAILQHGLSRSDAEMVEQQAMLSLRNQLNDAQVLILMIYGNFKRTYMDPDLDAFLAAHPGLFSVQPLSLGDSEEEQRRWTMYEHYESELAALGLLRHTEGIAKSGHQRQYAITDLGRLLLRSIDRYRDPNAPIPAGGA